jgi:hypothetical protein
VPEEAEGSGQVSQHVQGQVQVFQAKQLKNSFSYTVALIL